MKVCRLDLVAGEQTEVYVRFEADDLETNFAFLVFEKTDLVFQWEHSLDYRSESRFKLRKRETERSVKDELQFLLFPVIIFGS